MIIKDNNEFKMILTIINLDERVNKQFIDLNFIFENYIIFHLYCIILHLFLLINI